MSSFRDDRKSLTDIIDQVIILVEGNIEKDVFGEGAKTNAPLSPADAQRLKQLVGSLKEATEVDVLAEVVALVILSRVRSELIRHVKVESSSAHEVAHAHGCVAEAANFIANDEFMQSHLHMIHRWLVRAKRNMLKAQERVDISHMIPPKAAALIEELEKGG